MTAIISTSKSFTPLLHWPIFIKLVAIIMFRTVVILALLASVSAFVVKQPFPFSKTATAAASLRRLTSPAVAEGERELLDGPDGPILVTKVAGSYYAVDATCPHLGLPLKRGKISTNGDGATPTITCRFHNSCFSLETGKCTK
jgi:nitrite reductase/ring-hydroxylating ferredoxin subunit